jgi:hypothetical protein
MPHSRGSGRPMPAPEAIATTILTFRDAANVEWIRMPDGSLLEQLDDTVRASIRLALKSQRLVAEARRA